MRDQLVKITSHTKVRKNICGRSFQGKPKIDHINKIGHQCNDIDQKKPDVQEYLIELFIPEPEGKEAQDDVRGIDDQDSGDIKSESCHQQPGCIRNTQTREILKIKNKEDYSGKEKESQYQEQAEKYYQDNITLVTEYSFI